MTLHKGDYSKVKIEIQTLPNYGASSPELLTLIGGTQQLEIYIESILIIGDNYFASLHLVLSDTHGVDEEDTGVFEQYRSFSERSWKKRIAYTAAGEGLKAMWILQHRKNYKPFRVLIDLNLATNGTIK